MGCVVWGCADFPGTGRMIVPCKGAKASVLGERYNSETVKIFLDLGFDRGEGRGI